MAPIELALFGANYRTCSLEQREALLPEQIGPRLRRLKPRLQEAVVLATCHRLELYAVLNGPGSTEVLRAAIDGGPGEVLAQLYQCGGEEVARHLLRVSAGLDSLILGEAQVLGQVREAAEQARQWGLIGPVLSALFREAITCGRRVRSQVPLAGRWATLGTAAAELAQQKLGELTGKSALLLGAGRTTEMAALALRQRGVGPLWLASRTLSRAQAVAQGFRAQPVPFERVGEVLSQCHLLVSATTAPHPVVSRSLVEAAMAGRDFPLLILDLALPRDVEPSAAQVPGVSLFNVDQLPEVRDGLPSPQEVARAEALVAQEVERFLGWLREREAAPTVAALYRKAEGIRQQELDRALPRLSTLSPQQKETVQALTRAIVGKLLHGPIARCKAEAARDNGTLTLQRVRELFDLPGKGGSGEQAE